MRQVQFTKHRFGKVLVASAALMLVACARPAFFGDPAAIAALQQLPTPQYAASLDIAKTIASGCAGYSYNLPLERNVDALRNAEDRGTVAARGAANAVALEIDVTTRSLQARYMIDDLALGDRCAVAAGEVARQSGIGALLLPV